MQKARAFLNEWGVEVSEDDITLDQLWRGSNNYGGNIYGPDSERLAHVADFLRAVEALELRVREATRVAPFIPVDLRLRNASPTAASDLKVTVESADPHALELYEFVPQARTRLETMFETRRPDGRLATLEAKLERYSTALNSLVPQEEQALGELAAKILKPGTHGLTVTVRGGNLPEPQVFHLILDCVPEEN